jgi:hypothetical protein
MASGNFQSDHSKCGAHEKDFLGVPERHNPCRGIG